MWYIWHMVFNTKLWWKPRICYLGLILTRNRINVQIVICKNKPQVNCVEWRLIMVVDCTWCQLPMFIMCKCWLLNGTCNIIIIWYISGSYVTCTGYMWYKIMCDHLCTWNRTAVVHNYIMITQTTVHLYVSPNCVHNAWLLNLNAYIV